MLSLDRSRAGKCIAWLAFVLLAACGGGGDSSPPPPVAGPKLATLAEVGIASVSVADGGSPVYLMTGKQETLPIMLQLDSSTAASDLSVVTAGKGVLAATKDVSGEWQLKVNAAAMSNGESVPVQITITNSKLNKSAVVTAQLSFVAPVSTGTTISSAGGVVGPPELLIQVLPNDLTNPVGITVRRAVLADGVTTLVDISLDADIGDATVPLRLPPPPVMEAPAAATTKRPFAAVNPSDPLALELAWRDGTPFKNDASGANIGSNWRITQAWFSKGEYNGWRVYRLATEDVCLEWIPKINSSCFFRLAVELKPASELNAIVPKNFNSAAWTSFEPVLFVHGYTLGNKLGGGKDTWEQFPALVQSTDESGGFSP